MSPLFAKQGEILMETFNIPSTVVMKCARVPLKKYFLPLIFEIQH